MGTVPLIFKIRHPSLKGTAPLRGQGGLHEKFSELDFLVVSDRGDQYLSDVFSPIKKTVLSRSYYRLEVRATV